MAAERLLKDRVKKDNEALKLRATRLFTNVAAGNMGPDLYTNGGSQRYSNIIRANDQYIPYTGEVALIQASKNDIAEWAKNIDTVIVIGPGPAQTMLTKEVPILQLLPKLKTVKLIDLSEQFNIEAARALESKLNRQPIVETYTGDFRTITVNQNYQNALVITTGSLTNFEDASTDSFPSAIASSYLNRFEQLAKSGGKILWGYDSNSNKESLEQEYDTPEIAEFILNPLNKLAETNNVEIDPNGFSYTREFFPRSAHLAHYWAANRDQTIHIDDEVINVFNNDRFLCFSSIKLDPARLNVLAKEKGIEPYNDYRHAESKQVLHCFDCN